jgi:hypothetical protein
MTTQQHEKALQIRRALKNARRARRALWQAYPIGRRAWEAHGAMNAIDAVIAECYEAIDALEYECGYTRP